MAGNILRQINNVVQRIDNVLPSILARFFPPLEPMCVLAQPNHTPGWSDSSSSSKPFSLKDLLGDGILWAVPKSRRTIERRMKRKYGSPEINPNFPITKIILPKQTLRVCHQCGHDHEVGLLCPNCYEKVKKETEEMQQKIEKELGLDPVEKDVIVLYNGEKSSMPAEYWQGKRVVEMEKPRPMWFSKNLLQQSTQPLATTKDVKPTDLG